MARKKSGGKKSGNKGGSLGGSQGGGKPLGWPSEAQIGLVRVVADRHRLTLPVGWECDTPWVRLFLDCFAFDTTLHTGGGRMVWNIQQWFREERDWNDIALKIQGSLKHVQFIHDTLRQSGYALGAVIDSGDMLDVEAEDQSLADGAAYLDETVERPAPLKKLFEEWDEQDAHDSHHWHPEKDFRYPPRPY
jgi:hypothetical protein